MKLPLPPPVGIMQQSCWRQPNFRPISPSTMVVRSFSSRSIVVNVRRYTSSRQSTSANKALCNSEKDIPVPKPFNHSLKLMSRRNPNILNEYFQASGYQDKAMARLYDYFKIGQMVQQMDTPTERINFVNPFERGWERTEKKWHRVNHPNLSVPRKAWSLPPIPNYFDVENYYMHITKTIQPTQHKGEPLTDEQRVKLWNLCYQDLNMPVVLFERHVTESLISALNGATRLDQDSANRFLAQFINHGQTALAHNHSFLDQRVSFNPRCESFWICAGFEELYKTVNMSTGHVRKNRRFSKKYTGDNRHMLGELVFTMRDKLVAQMRQREPLTRIDLESSPVGDYFAKTDYSFSFDGLLPPWIYNLNRDARHLWQVPGYELDSGEQISYGRVAIKNSYNIDERIEFWGMTDKQEVQETRTELLRATAISTLFNWLNAQAHCAGYTQYTDDGSINLSSQLVLSDGQEFFFAAGQLRSIAFNVNWDKMTQSAPGQVEVFPPRAPNRVIFEGPYNLYDEHDIATQTFKHRDARTGLMKNGLNPLVLQYFLNMLVMK